MSFAGFVIPSFPLFNEESIEVYIAGAQNYTKGCALVACGDVHEVKLKVSTPELWTYSGIVHSKLTANKHYLVSATFDKSAIVSTSCVCLAAPNAHNKCKHQAALLLALFSIKNYPYCQGPKWAMRKRKVKRFFSPGTSLHKKTKVDLTWSDVLQGFSLVSPKHGTKTAVIQREPPKKKIRKRKVYCLCKEPKEKERKMIRCEVCKDWYHPECVEKIGKKVEKPFICLLKKSCFPKPSQSSATSASSLAVLHSSLSPSLMHPTRTLTSSKPSSSNIPISFSVSPSLSSPKPFTSLAQIHSHLKKNNEN